jgi:pectate lyase
MIGWATMEGGTTGGGDAQPQYVDNLGDLNDAGGGSKPRVIYVSGKLSGSLKGCIKQKCN